MGSLRKKAMPLLAVIAILGGCTGVNVSQDYDPSAVAYDRRTWQWEAPTQPPTGDVRVDNPLLNKRIRQAIERHLAGRNIEQGRHRPDLYVRYHLTIQPKLQSYSSYSTLGMGGYYYPWSWGYDADTRIYQYDECQLTVDIEAADAKTLLWRGTGVYRYKSYKTPQAAAEEMQLIVDRILGQFPPVEK